MYDMFVAGVKMNLDRILENLDDNLLQELEDIYELWSWHPGMG